MTTDNEENFGDDGWGDEVVKEAPRGPSNVQFEEPIRPTRKPTKKKTSRKSAKVGSTNKLSAEDAFKSLQAQMAGDAASKGPKGKFSMGKGNLNSPLSMALVGAIIALVISIAVSMYCAPTRGQFTTLVNQHNSLNGSVTTLQDQVGGKVDSSSLEIEKTRIDDQVAITAALNSTVQILWSNVGNLSSSSLVQYLKVTDIYSFGGNSSGNVSGNLSTVLGNYWDKWLGLSDSYDPNSIFSVGGGSTGNYSGDLVGGLNSLWNISTTANNSVNSLSGVVSGLSNSVDNSVVELTNSISDLTTDLDTLKSQLFTVGNCLNCNVEQALLYMYNGSRSGDWSYPNNYP